MYNIGIIYADGEFSKHRKSELMGSEVIYIKNTLLKQFEVNNVHILATANNSEADIQINNSDELNKYDILILFWSSTNQWGGELNYSQYLVYKFLHNYSGMILYWLEDSRFPCTQLIDVIAERKWWKENPLCNNEELKLPSNIHMLSMFNDIDFVYRLHKNIDIKSVHNISAYLTHLDDRPVNIPLFGKSVDLIYGGFNRALKRNNFYNEYFINRKNITTELYGTLSKDLSDVDTKNCIISDRVPYKQVLTKNASGLATIIPAEKNYNNNCITPRLVEALKSNIICFIQNDFDEEHKILQNDFFYVSSGDELEEKILLTKNNFNLYNELMSIQQAKLNDLMKINLGEEIIAIVNELKED